MMIIMDICFIIMWKWIIIITWQFLLTRSKNPGSEDVVAAGVYIPEFNVEISKIIIDGVSVFTAEIVAVILGLQRIEELRPERIVICSDSAAALSSLNSKETSRDDLLLEKFTILLRIQRVGTDVQFLNRWTDEMRWTDEFCWVPAHVGVKGNKKADDIAKRALKLNDNIIMKFPFRKGEAKSLIKRQWGICGRRSGTQIIKGDAIITNQSCWKHL